MGRRILHNLVKTFRSGRAGTRKQQVTNRGPSAERLFARPTKEDNLAKNSGFRQAGTRKQQVANHGPSAERLFARPTILFLLAGVLLFCALLFLFLEHHTVVRMLAQAQALLHDSDRLREAILAKGVLAPFLFVGLQIVQVVLFPLPGEASGFLGGYLFGVWGGFFYSTLGLAIGSWLAFGISNLFGKAVQARLAHTSGYRRFNHLVAKGDFVIPFLLFLLPGFPKDSLSYLLGLSRMPWRVFLFIAAIGRIPGTLMLSLQGAQVFERDFFTLFLLLAGSLLFSLPFYLNRHRLVAWLERLGRPRQGSEVITSSSFSGPDDRL